MPKAVDCIFCSGRAHPYFDKKTRRGTYSVFRCGACRSAFIWPRPSAKDSLSIYRSSGYSDLSRETADELDKDYYPNSRMDALRIIGSCRELARGRSFLDVGAGSGVFSQVAQEAGFEVHACEPSPKARAIYASRLGKKPEARGFDAKTADRMRGRFDIVLLSQTLEHIPDPEAMVLNISLVLRPGGLAAIAVPHFGSMLSRIQGRRDMFISPPEHLNFFSRAGLVALFNRSGFRPEHIETVSKIPKKYVRRILRNPALTQVGWRGGYGLLRVLDRLDLGMVLNAYFRKR